MKRLCCAYSVGKAERTAVQEVLMGCAEESPYIFFRNICPVGFLAGCGPKWCRERAESTLPAPQRETSAKEISPVGNDAPTPAREKGLQPYGALDCFGWRSEGGRGKRREDARRVALGQPGLPLAD